MSNNLNNYNNNFGNHSINNYNHHPEPLDPSAYIADRTDHTHHPIPPRTKERKSRRSHKNSRDGCPNCKQKRIKCSEELPSCLNCIKKNYHCGYLDYPKEKLDALRRKHAQIASEEMEEGASEGILSSNEQPIVTASGKRRRPSAAVALTTSQNVPNTSLNNGGNSVLGDKSYNNTTNVTSKFEPFHNSAPDTFPNKTKRMRLGPALQHYDLTSLQVPPNFAESNTRELFQGFLTTITPPTSNKAVSLNSSPFSESPNNTNELFKNYSASKIPNVSENDTTPPNLFIPMQESEWDKLLNVPLEDVDLNLALYKDAMSKLSSSQGLHLPETFGNGRKQPKWGQVGRHGVSTLNGTANEANIVDTDAVKYSITNTDPNTNTNTNATTDANANTDTDTDTKAKTDVQDFDTRSVDSFENSTSIFNQHFGINIYELSAPERQDLSRKIDMDKALPNAILCLKTFPTLKRSQSLHPLFTKGSSKCKWTYNCLMLLSNPDWTLEDDKKMWMSNFTQALVLHFIFFTFFMDRSLNVILKVCNKSISSTSSTTCFTPEIQKILTKKSYSYFGNLIKDLRESIAGVDIESSTIISWLSGWSRFLHTQASAKAVTLFHAGSASLLWNCLDRYTGFEEISPTLQFIIFALRNHTSTAVAPDYKFDVIAELHTNLVQFKTFINYNPELTSQRNGYIIKNFLALESFLNDLITTLYPRFLQIDKYFKTKNGDTDTESGIRYFSPSLLYEFINRWLKLIPSYSRSMGSEMSPLKRTFYLFYVATAKALSNVFPIIRSTYLIDTWNAIYPQVDFNYKLFAYSRSDVADDSQYHYLTNLSAKLLRIIKFFNTRQQIISHYMSSTSILETGGQYLELVAAEGPIIDGQQFSGIVHLKPAKIDFKEIMITNFSINTIVNIYNYPLLINFGAHLNGRTEEYRKIIEHENHNQKVRIHEYRQKYEGLSGGNQPLYEDGFFTNINHSYEFDFSRGMYSFDYKVEPAVNYFYKYLEKAHAGKQLSLNQLKDEIQNFEAAQKALFGSMDEPNGV